MNASTDLERERLSGELRWADGKRKVAIVTGVTGQDGAYLSELLLGKGYEVHGIKRRSSMFNTGRIDHLHEDRHVAKRPTPEYTANANGIGTLRILEAIRILGLERKTRFYQASSSELYGLVQQSPQTETSPFYPRSPYAAAKLYAYWITVNYREAYGLYACNGILFNHESPIRGETFVTRKITRAMARIALGLQECLYLGNLSAMRDWGHAKDYVEAQWLMLQQDRPEDFVVATGVQHSVREFVAMAAGELGISLTFSGSGADEIATVERVEGDRASCRVGDVVVRVDAAYFRPTEVQTLLGDATKAREKLGWTATTTLAQLVSEMVAADYLSARRDNLVREAGYQIYDYNE